MNKIDDPIPTRQSLLGRLSNWSDQESWRVFFDTYWKLIYGAATRAGLTDAESQDVVQETVISVMKGMPNFKYDATKGSFKGWLLRLTSWRITDQLRKRQRRIEDRDRLRDPSTETKSIEQVADPVGVRLEATWDEEWEKNLLDAAMERVKKKVDPQHYQVFDLYAIKQWPVAKVAKTMKINSGKVYLIKHRVSRLIKKEITYLREETI
ncbi:MAG TPA: sigma-70 family RNA polymerase sigma factor [Verrucomicrobiae bacterium]|nr:sigma-70 family RNA polymerase sigma factor [Verrucomicrobiae bacterium]